MMKKGGKEEPTLGENLGKQRRQSKEEEKKIKQEQKQRPQKADVLIDLNATQFKHLQPKTDENLDYSSEEKTTGYIFSFIH